MANDTERLREDIKELEERLRKVETVLAVQGLKVGAIAVLMVTTFSAIGAVISHKLSWIAKWWAGQ